MQIKNIEQELKKFVQEHKDVTIENVRQTREYIDSNKDIWPHLNDKYYGEMILWVSNAYKKLDNTSEAISFLEEQIEKFSSVYKYAYGFKSVMFYQLGVYYLLEQIKGKGLEALKKSIFYSLIPNESYNGFEFYSFRTCNKYALDDLRNNTLTVSNPKVFNDPFDCLLFHWYENKMDISQNQHDKELCGIIEEAFSFIKIRCFVCNTPLPTDIEENPSKRSEVEERYNPLMWAHYADGHKGFCVKYKFLSGMTKTIIRDDFERYELSRWGNVEYVENVNINDEMDRERAFFTKSKVWEYENEVRFLHYDPQWKGDFKAIELHTNSIEEVYFGLHCPKENEEKIREALIGQSVKFYKIEKQPEDFYKLTSREV